MRFKLLVLLVWAGMWGANQLLPDWYETRFMPASQFRTMPDVLLDVLGEGRTMLARLLWYQMDLYHEILGDQGVVEANETEVLPLLRMVTYLDPHMDDAYDLMAWDLYKGSGKYEAAHNLLTEGLAYNPESRTLQFGLALIEYRSKHYELAIEPGLAALRLSSHEIDKLNALRILFRSEYELKNWPLCMRILNWWLELRPKDSVALQAAVETSRKIREEAERKQQP